MVRLQPGVKASGADCIVPGTNLVWDLGNIRLSEDLTMYLVSGSQGNPGRKTKVSQEVGLWFRRWHSAPWVTHPCRGPLLQVNPAPRLWVLTAPCCKMPADTCHKNSSIHPVSWLYYKLGNYLKVLVALIAYGCFCCTSFPLLCVASLALLQ